MADTLLLQLVSPERMLVDEQVTEAQIPALDGFIGVLPGHAPLVSELMAGGVLSYQAAGKEQVLAVYGGFVEVLQDRVRVLADAAERREEIDLKAAQEQLVKATAAAQHMQDNPEVAIADVLRAQAKVDAATRQTLRD
jgi:F-type H+-transporting ATPase subunit epsilon